VGAVAQQRDLRLPEEGDLRFSNGPRCVGLRSLVAEPGLLAARCRGAGDRRRSAGSHHTGQALRHGGRSGLPATT